MLLEPKSLDFTLGRENSTFLAPTPVRAGQLGTSFGPLTISEARSLGARQTVDSHSRCQLSWPTLRPDISPGDKAAGGGSPSVRTMQSPKGAAQHLNANGDLPAECDIQNPVESTPLVLWKKPRSESSIQALSDSSAADHLQHQDQFSALQYAARIEISELRQRLQEAHGVLAETRAEQTLSVAKDFSARRGHGSHREYRLFQFVLRRWHSSQRKYSLLKSFTRWSNFAASGRQKSELLEYQMAQISPTSSSSESFVRETIGRVWRRLLSSAFSAFRWQATVNAADRRWERHCLRVVVETELDWRCRLSIQRTWCAWTQHMRFMSDNFHLQTQLDDMHALFDQYHKQDSYNCKVRRWQCARVFNATIDRLDINSRDLRVAFDGWRGLQVEQCRFAMALETARAQALSEERRHRAIALLNRASVGAGLLMLCEVLACWRVLLLERLRSNGTKFRERAEKNKCISLAILLKTNEDIDLKVAFDTWRCFQVQQSRFSMELKTTRAQAFFKERLHCAIALLLNRTSFDTGSLILCEAWASWRLLLLEKWHYCRSRSRQRAEEISFRGLAIRLKAIEEVIIFNVFHSFVAWRKRWMQFKLILPASQDDASLILLQTFDAWKSELFSKLHMACNSFVSWRKRWMQFQLKRPAPQDDEWLILLQTFDAWKSELFSKLHKACHSFVAWRKRWIEFQLRSPSQHDAWLILLQTFDAWKSDLFSKIHSRIRQCSSAARRSLESCRARHAFFIARVVFWRWRGSYFRARLLDPTSCTSKESKSQQLPPPPTSVLLAPSRQINMVPAWDSSLLGTPLVHAHGRTSVSPLSWIWNRYEISIALRWFGIWRHMCMEKRLEKALTRAKRLSVQLISVQRATEAIALFNQRVVLIAAIELWWDVVLQHRGTDDEAGMHYEARVGGDVSLKT